MNTPTLRKFLSSMSVAMFAFSTPAAFADDDRDDHDDDDHTDRNRTAALVVSLEARTRLAPPGAPAISGPTGAAELEARKVNGVTRVEVEVTTRGLAADTYTVAVTKKSDGSTLTLGTFAVAATVPPVTSGKRHRESDDRKGKREIKFGTKSGRPLPAGFDGFDVASISVIGSAGAVTLAGDLTQRVDLVKRARLVADASIPRASGSVSISSTTRAGVAKSRFVLTAKGLPAGVALQLAIDGADVQAVTPSTRGYVTVRSLPASVDIPAITTVVIHDAANVNLLSAGF